MLLSLGAIIYVKTTTPQGQLSMDTHSLLLGRTYNPINYNLTIGGSSGGEVVLIAMRGGIRGIGTDLAGSIRILAMYCGIYGFQPSLRLTLAMGTEQDYPPGSQVIIQPVKLPFSIVVL